MYLQNHIRQNTTVNERDFSEIGEREVVVKTMVSTISAGTERANFIGDSTVTVAKDIVVDFPRTVGYSSAGEVVAVDCHLKI